MLHLTAKCLIHLIGILGTEVFLAEKKRLRRTHNWHMEALLCSSVVRLRHTYVRRYVPLRLNDLMPGSCAPKVRHLVSFPVRYKPIWYLEFLAPILTTS